MLSVTRVGELREVLAGPRRSGKKIAFVPTMGFFHEGHLALMREARKSADLVVVSIFVNPLQFGPSEDYRAYPRDPGRDSGAAAAQGVDVLFTPAVSDVYPEGFRTHVEVEGLSGVMCGASRPGHFRGVATVVTKLLGMVQPDAAFFGQKDAQQLLIMRRLARDLDMPVAIEAVDTVRDSDGLALSSRNVYLEGAGRRAAAALYRSLTETERLVSGGERDAGRVKGAIERVLSSEPLVRPDYVAVVEPDGLAGLDRVEGRVLIALAAFVGRARLIDNVALEVEGSRVRRILL